MKHMPFTLEGLSPIPSLLEESDYIASSDEKSAYQGIKRSENSKTYFGVQFGGFYFQYTVLPFGWSISPFVYQTIGMQVTTLLRTRGMITTRYLDDRFLSPLLGIRKPAMTSTGLSIYYNAAVLTCLGFTIEFAKSFWFPVLKMIHLGLIVHSDLRVFEIPLEKKEAFKVLRESILTENFIQVKSLQKLMGKCISFLSLRPKCQIIHSTNGKKQ